jgi:PAB1-binding protein PBP1
MTTKKLYVSSTVQAALLKDVLIPEMANGFWKNDRPSNHAAQWADVEIIVSTTDQLGAADGFVVPRLYNFVNPEFIKPNEAQLVATAQTVKASSNFRSVKKELIELSRIVGGRLTDKNSVPTKANRGNNKTGTIQETVSRAKKTVVKAKKTAVKDPSVIVQRTSSGATVRRVAVTRITETA